MKYAASLLLVGVFVCAASSLSWAQTPEGKTSAAKAQPEPTPPQAIRDIGKVLRERDREAAGSPAPTPDKSKERLVTRIHLPVIHAGNRNFAPGTMKCAEAIEHALEIEQLVPAPDDNCADMMEDALDARLRTGQ